MYKILIITDSFVGAKGGSEKHIKDLSEGLPKDTYQIDIVQLAFVDSIPNPTGTVNQNIRYHHFPVKRVYGLSGMQARQGISQLIKTQNIQLCISFHEMADIINATLTDNVVKLSSRRDMGFKRNNILEKMIRWANSQFNYILCPSVAVQQKVISEGINIARTHLLYNGIDSDGFTTINEQTTEQKNNLITELGATPRQINILSIGNLNEWKGHQYLVKAIAQAKDVDCTLVVFGDGPARSSLEADIDNLGIRDRVTLYGYCPNVKKYLSAFDIMALPSLTEGLSNALLESAASAIPMIATNVGGNPEVVEDGVNGILVEPADSQAFAKAIPLLTPSTEKYAQASAASREIAEQKFSLQSMLKNYQQLFSELITKELT